MSNHTPDFTDLRLTVDETGESGIGNIQDLNDNSVAIVQEPAIASAMERNKFRQKLAVEIAKRWNTYAGMESPAEEIAQLRADVTKWHEESKRLAEQNFKLRSDRQRLVEALEKTMERVPPKSIPSDLYWDNVGLLTKMEQK